MTQDTTKTVASPSGLQRVTVLGTGVLGAQIAFQGSSQNSDRKVLQGLPHESQTESPPP